MMNDFRKNAEGYNDPTPYNAMKNIEGGHNMNINAGEIWECSCGYNKLKLFLVLKVIKKVALVLALNEDRKCEDDIEVICKGIRFTTPYMVSYKFEEGFVNYVKSMKEDEFETLLDVVGGHLGFEADGNTFEEATHEMVNELKMKLEDSERNLESKRSHIERMKERILELEAELVNLKTDQSFAESGILEKEKRRLEIKCELLQEQNEKLLDRLAG